MSEQACFTGEQTRALLDFTAKAAGLRGAMMNQLHRLGRLAEWVPEQLAPVRADLDAALEAMTRSQRELFALFLGGLPPDPLHPRLGPPLWPHLCDELMAHLHQHADALRRSREVNARLRSRIHDLTREALDLQERKIASAPDKFDSLEEAPAENWGVA